MTVKLHCLLETTESSLGMYSFYPVKVVYMLLKSTCIQQQHCVLEN